jgi:opacity protein-like surface antigen
MKEKTYIVGVAVLLAALLALSGVAQSAMWVGAELGGNFPMSPMAKAAGIELGGVDFDGTVIGGATMGYDFVNSGFGAYAWPDWMKYFSIATDITYNPLRVHSIGGNAVLFTDKGYCVAWTFLLMAHYGLFPDSEIPSGRVNPYIGVGPAIVWSGITIGQFNGNSTNIGLVVEPGIRWVALKNVSIDTSFRYRMASPSYTFVGVDTKLEPLHQLSFLVRANYHF